MAKIKKENLKFYVRWKINFILIYEIPAYIPDKSLRICKAKLCT